VAATSPSTSTGALAFDRSLGVLYAWHDDGYDTLEKCRLSSQPVAGQAWRRLDTIRIFAGPDHANNEGESLTVDARVSKAPTERVELRWGLGSAPYTLRRATTPGFRDGVVSFWWTNRT
jgi:hypothetical protein